MICNVERVGDPTLALPKPGCIHLGRESVIYTSGEVDD